MLQDEASVDSDPFGVICVFAFHTLLIFLCAYSQCAFPSVLFPC